MKHSLFLVPMAVSCLFAQAATPAQDAAAQAQKKTLTDAASAGAPLPATIDVSGNVNIEAVMLPRGICRRVFGKEVANEYAVIEVNISNRSKDAALILQSLFIDMSGWGLAGPLGGDAGAGYAAKGKPYQTRANSKEVASVEYRIVRGQMLDAQPWSTRNVALRTIQVFGSIGTAFAFPFTKDVVAGIGAWNGAVVPGFQAMFPDGMVGQMDRISDYGFRNNKVIAQQSADIVIAFFPIERFLPPTLGRVFLDEPSLFFNPTLMVIDPKTQTVLQPVLRNVFGSDEKVKAKFTKMLGEYASLDQNKVGDDREALEDATDALSEARSALGKAQSAVDDDTAASAPNAALVANHKAALDARQAQLTAAQTAWSAKKAALDADLAPLKKDPLYVFLSGVSLNNVHVTVSGVMTVDVAAVPAAIEASCFDRATADMWAVAGDKTCTLDGHFLSGGTPSIPQADTLGISAIAVTKDASTDQSLKFTYKLAKALDPATVEFDIVVTKQTKDGKSVDSMKYHVKSAFTLPAPAIAKVTPPKDNSITVTGTGFYSTPKNALAAALHPASGDDVALTVTAGAASTSFMAAIDAKTAPGCYAAIAKVGAVASAASRDPVLVAAAPKITAAKWSGTSVEVTGEQMVNTQACGGSTPEFELLDAAHAVLGKAIPLPANSTAVKATLALPTGVDAAKVSSIRLYGASDNGIAVTK